MVEFIISARNALKGVIKEITTGAVNAEVLVEIINGVKIVFLIESIVSFDGG